MRARSGAAGAMLESAPRGRESPANARARASAKVPRRFPHRESSSASRATKRPMCGRRGLQRRARRGRVSTRGRDRPRNDDLQAAERPISMEPRIGSGSRPLERLHGWTTGHSPNCATWPGATPSSRPAQTTCGRATRRRTDCGAAPRQSTPSSRRSRRRTRAVAPPSPRRSGSSRAGATSWSRRR